MTAANTASKTASRDKEAAYAHVVDFLLSRGGSWPQGKGEILLDNGCENSPNCMAAHPMKGILSESSIASPPLLSLPRPDPFAVRDSCHTQSLQP